MKRSEMIAVMMCMAPGILAPAIAAATDANAALANTGDAKNLLKIIEEQQRQIDAQEAQLKEQKKALEELRNAVNSLAVPGESPAISPAVTADTGQETVAPSPTEHKSYQTTGAADPDEWPGFYRVPGTNTRYKFSGFAETDLIHDTDAVLTPGAFLTSAIVTRNATDAQGASGKTSFSVQASRLAFETRTPLSGGDGDRRVTTFISFDFFDDFLSTKPEVRMRQAYGEVTNFMMSGGDLLLGQDWTTFTNLYAVPGTLEFQAPNAVFGSRHPMARWTQHLGDDMKLKLAAEAPDLRSYEGGADSVSRWPDGVVALSWERPAYNIMASYLARDLRASNGAAAIGSAYGWGASLQGRVYMPEAIKDDFLMFSLAHGDGIGGLMNDVPPDAMYNAATNELELIPTTGLVLGYQHQWSPNYYSLLTYGQLDQDNLDIQAATAFNKTTYSSLNFVWTPDPRWLLGVEMVYGTREDKDGTKASNTRSVVTGRFNF